jgi:hypothetical protein
MVNPNAKDVPCNLPNPAPFATMDKDKLRAITSKAGKGNLGLTKIHYTKCIKCELKDTCERAFEEAKKIRAKGEEVEKTGVNPFSINIEKAKNYPMDDARCMYEIEHNTGLKNKAMKSYMAFLSPNPEPLLMKIHLIFSKLEGLTKVDPSFAKYAQMYYMLTNLYKMKHESDKGTSVNINNNSKENTTMDIKVIMNKMRGTPTQEPIVVHEAEVVEEDDESNEDDEDEETKGGGP